ncbi:MAG: ribosome biogenesis GTPase Der [Bacillota bacterium]|jgi:GTP-binding protein|nr:ribosome biogenesis GTPase Der [Bacillota bacterium]
MSSLFVAIVGRPNVGKSTLFNRIIGKRVAIVEDTPGVTRDRIYGKAKWLGVPMTVIDTGGLDFGSKTSVSAAVRFQAQVAIDEADVVLFVVDAREGITANDREIADILRRTTKPVVLTANKVEDFTSDHSYLDFYELGLGRPVPISAAHGMNIGDLLDIIISHRPPEQVVRYDQSAIRIAVVGRPNVGKSSLVNTMLGQERSIVDSVPGTTRDAIDTQFHRDGQHYVIVDTAGLRRKGRILESIERYSALRTLRAVDDCDVSLVLLDATEGVTDQDARIAGYVDDAGRAMCILVNKWDSVDKDSTSAREFELRIRQALTFAHYAPILFISAKTGLGIDGVFGSIHRVVEQYRREVPTALLNEILEEAVLRNPPPSRRGKPLSVYYMTQIGTSPPRFRLFVNKADRMHFSYLRYIENELRTSLGFEGTPIKLHIAERK